MLCSSDNEEFTYTSTSRVGCIPTLKPLLLSFSPYDVLDIDDAGCTTHKDLHFSQSLTVASESYQ